MVRARRLNQRLPMVIISLLIGLVSPAVAAEGPQNALSIYLNDLNFTGWQAQPFYMWKYAAPPMVMPSVTTASADKAPAISRAEKTANAPVVEKAAGSTVAEVAPALTPQFQSGVVLSDQSIHSDSPRLPDGDPLKQAILAEYRLTGFFRKSFQRGQRIIYIDAYDFQSADGAYGAYNYLRRGATTVMPRGDAASEDDDSISIVQGKTFLSIYGTSQDDDESKEVMTKVAVQALKYIPDKGLQAPILSRLPRVELVHGSEKIVMGPQTARRFFPAPFLGAIALDGGRVIGCVGDYQIQEPAKERVKLMVLTYSSPALAQQSCQNFLAQMAEAHNTDVSTLLAQQINVLKSGNTYLGIQQRGSDVLMVTGARKRFSPALVLRQVR